MAQDELFSVRRSAAQGTPSLLLHGELDAYTAPILREAIADELRGDGYPLVLDCSDLHFIDGSGLRVIEWAVAAAAPRPVEICSASPVLRQLAAIVGLDRQVVFAPNRRAIRAS
ncbi:MAG: anti-sigma factor antagonist [Actinomycetota bacterium]|nr:anti-sigma factor antagonist [Actinomycetota bacterium]